MKDLDLYKAIILLSVVLIPVAGWFAYNETKQLEYGQKAVRNATKRGGVLERIGALQKQLEGIKASIREEGGLGHLIYFDRRINESARGNDLKQTDYTIGDEQVRMKKSLRANDYEVDIQFRRNNKPLPLPRPFVHAVLLNCEAFSESWRLRKLQMRHAEHFKARGSKPPPKTISDNWDVQKITFARREPAKKG